MLTQDTRKLKPGDTYIALRGERLDGHDYVRLAFELGAAEAWVCADWQVPPELIGRKFRVFEDTRKALFTEAAAYRQQLNCFTLGVTGSAGKTTTKELAAAVFSAAGVTGATQGNYNNDIGLPLTILNLPRDVRYAMIEAGTNHPGEIAPLAACMLPAAAIITCIAPVHIEYFGSVEAIADEKAELFRAVPSNGYCVALLDDPMFPRLAAAAKGRVVSVSLADERADYTASKLDLPDVGLPGQHNKIDLLLVYAAAREAGLSHELICKGLAGFTPPAMRWERTKHGEVEVINDAYNANPLSMTCALRTFADTPAQSRVAVVGDMLELGAFSMELHYRVGKEAGNGPWRLLVIVGEAAKELARGAMEAGYPGDRVLYFPDSATAAARNREFVRAGDTVLLKASRSIKLEHVLKSLQ